jgi:hypothetical protein
MRSFDGSSSNQCVERRLGLGCVRFDHAHLLDNAPLKFDAIFNVLQFPRDVDKSFASLIAHDSIPHLARLEGVALIG